MPPRLARITIFPIKAFPGVDVPERRVLPSGSLDLDRRFAIRSPDGRFVNSKRTASIHLIDAQYNAALDAVTLIQKGDVSPPLRFIDDCLAIESRLSLALGEDVRWDDNPQTGFPDDTNAPGPTVISAATLAEVASWFPGMSVDEARGRFRSNLEIDGVPAFWEDGLYGDGPSESGLVIDGVRFVCVNPCQRCVTPTRAPWGGEPTARFVQIFTEQRERTLPADVARPRFDHFYRLAVNTRLHPSSSGGVIHVGAEVCLESAAHE